MSYSRKDFRALPLDRILVPTLDGPILRYFFDAPTFTDRDGRQCLCKPMLHELRGREPRKPHDMATNAPARTAYLVKYEVFTDQVRSIWNQMVDQASGYFFTSGPAAMLLDERGVFEFAPDA